MQIQIRDIFLNQPVLSSWELKLGVLMNGFEFDVQGSPEAETLASDWKPAWGLKITGLSGDFLSFLELCQN